MSIVPKDSVRFQVALAVLVMITLSWIVSTGLANYLNYLNIQSVRREMLKHPDIYSEPIPEPRFGILDFVLGHPPRSLGRIGPGPPVRPSEPPPPGVPGPDGPPFPQRPRVDLPPGNGARMPSVGPSPRVFSPVDLKWMLLRLAVAVALAILAAIWLGRKFTKPLLELAKGAREFHDRRFEYRLPEKGKSEFTAVASAMNRMAEEVAHHIHSLEEDAERRRQFLADIAHELRSPVTTIRTMAGALQDGVADEPERRERAVSVLVRTSERMFRLVQDVMELVELDLDRLPIAKTDVDLRGLVAAVIASYEREAAKAGITLTPLEPGAPVNANVDPDRITQVIDNVVGNAISYAGTGAAVSVAIEDGDPMKISIADTGVGIPAEDLPHVLDSFYRVNAARTPGENHIGLGLSIARRMLEAHGGRIAITSEEGKGTAVHILIPKV